MGRLGLRPDVCLMEHQQSALSMVERLMNSGAGGMLLADPPGMGKTRVGAACLASALSRTSGLGLLVVPRVLYAMWCEELRASLEERLLSLWCYPEAVSRATVPPGVRVVITTYEKLGVALKRGWSRDPRNGWVRQQGHPLLDTEYEVVVLDEVHALCNSGALARHALDIISERGAFRLGLTGTPMRNGVTDMANLSAALGAPPYYHCHHNWYRMNNTKLYEYRRDFMLRRDKRNTTALPACDERDVVVQCTEEEVSYHDKLVDDMTSHLLSGTKTCVHLHALLTRMRQCAISPDLARTFECEERAKRVQLISRNSSSTINAALSECSRMIEAGRKVILFCEFTTALEAIAKIAKRTLGLPRVEVFSGNSPASVLDEFRDDPEQPLLLVSLKAGGQGLNLAEHASGVVIVGHWWNTCGIRQAIDRVHRMGQRRDVEARVIVAKDTIDEVVRTGMHRAKDAAARRLLDTMHMEAETRLGVEEIATLMDALKHKRLRRSCEKRKIDEETVRTTKRICAN